MDIDTQRGTANYVADLHASLRRIEARLRLREALRLAPVAVALGLGAAMMLALVSRFSERLSVPVALVSAAIFPLAALVASTLYALLRPRDPMQTARRADALLGMDERLATALESAQKHDISLADGEMLREIQLQDAAARAANLEPARDLPLKVEPRKWLPAGALLVLALAVLVSPTPAASDPEADAVRAQLEKEAAKIEAIAETLAKDPRLAEDPRLQELLSELGDLARDLDADNLTREEALARLSEAEGTLQRALDPQARGEAEALEKLADELARADSPAAKEAGEALKSGDNQKAAEALDKLAKEAGAASQAEREALARSLEEAREDIAALDPETAQRLNEAAEALRGEDPQAAQRALEELRDQVSESAERAATQEQVRQALAQIQAGKQNVATAGQPTPGTAGGTAIASAGTPRSGTPAAGGSPMAGTPPGFGSAVVGASPVGSAIPGTNTPPVARTTPGTGGTPVAVMTPGTGSGQGQGSGQNSGQGQGQGSSQGTGTNAGQGGTSGWGSAHQEPVSVPPNWVNAQGTPLALTGQDNPDGDSSSTQTGTDVNTTGPAQVPYSEVYGTYREQAGKALDSDYIPQGYKDLVRDYFTQLEP
jgi:hypothetical protein